MTWEDRHQIVGLSSKACSTVRYENSARYMQIPLCKEGSVYVSASSSAVERNEKTVKAVITQQQCRLQQQWYEHQVCVP